ncbi:MULTISPECIES: hypothetical protein [Oscillospiraceae]|uniref:Uncharacterized protein n=1 Tax=Lawsonibacter faecis TaxID=2763052 RepID=A0A8J6JAP3_9FIRM|nr:MULTISPECIES: hypothetical protein [Oscillospiraceae]MTQ97220.1 hypothetical protein [Pseudoflavonifractor sp. BIOML-A16]MTR05258.1 hypothetical protein [Pseudoflavonifractor sp. BIOML-A15]MTR31525.1 hypothetical protein [Pseudoflavonifractor sp. BIOML-A14]MTR72211.1 hypothetical protein [Pseudoflavonifractor sp. BIOML-A18]MTS63049.1 hypothetical protein [Pseudoflavonifractor sp. BIOML-A5]MTS70613.1 hypothetical protein [Pseudoflavonifractor sp. BIOML-A8]MTS91331.1 hypothetical protein [P
MEGKNRTLFVVLIAIVIVAAVFSSFGLNLFAPGTPEISLPDPSAGPVESPGGEDQPDDTGRYVRVDVTPQTVQDVIRTMVPLQPESYYRTITVGTARGDGTLGETVSRVWVDHGWTKVESTWPNGVVEYTVVGGGRGYRWFEGDRTWNEWDVGDRDANLAQRIPTYEDVLGLDAKSITATGYEEKNGSSCIYVEVAENEVGNRERYWVSVSSGLLVAAETMKGEEAVLTMTAEQVEMPVPPGVSFALPDGSVLHEIKS